MTPEGMTRLNRRTKFTSDIDRIGKDWKSHFDMAAERENVEQNNVLLRFLTFGGKERKTDLEDKYERDEG